MPRIVAHLQAQDVVGAGAERRIRLGDHLIGAAEAVEVVDIDRTKIGLHGVKDILHAHAQLLRLDAVQMREQLRHPDGEVGEDALQRGLFHGFHLDLHHHAGQRGIAQVGAVFHLQLEAADGAQPLHGRRREDGDDGVAPLRIFHLQLLGDRQPRQRRAMAFVKGLQAHEHNAGRRAVDEAVDAKAWKGDGGVHARFLERDGGHFADDFFGTVQGGALRQLRETHQILLVLDRHEARRHQLEHGDRGRQQHAVHDKCRGLAVQDGAHAPAVIFRTARKDPVEPAEEAAEHGVHAARQPVLGRVMPPQQQRRQSR